MQDKLMPKGKWEFDIDVTSCFGDMLKRSIPDYYVMRSLCYRFGVEAIGDKKHPIIVDLGCSTGFSVEPFVKKYSDIATFYLYDVSEPMRKEAQERFKDFPKVYVCENDIAHDYPWHLGVDLTLSVLTLQFTPLEYRQQILRNIYFYLNKGGAFILVEKVLGESADADDALRKQYYRLKSENGYTQEQIQAKMKSLEGVLVPVKASWNEELLRNAGFKNITRFLSCLNFCGWIAYK